MVVCITETNLFKNCVDNVAECCLKCPTYVIVTQNLILYNIELFKFISNVSLSNQYEVTLVLI